jgi:hypothetical protein
VLPLCAPQAAVKLGMQSRLVHRYP